MSEDRNERLDGDRAVENATIDDHHPNVGAGGSVGAAGIGAADALGTEEDHVTAATGAGSVSDGSAGGMTPNSGGKTSEELTTRRLQ